MKGETIFEFHNILSLNANFQNHKFPFRTKKKEEAKNGNGSPCAESLSIYMRTLWDNLFLSAKSK